MGVSTGAEQSPNADTLHAIWAALADLFLDTERQDHGYRHIARTIFASGLSEQRLKQILLADVTPRFGPNVFANLLGQWGCWSDDQVREIMSQPPPRLQRFFVSKKEVCKYIDEAWQRILAARQAPDEPVSDSDV